MILIPVKPLSVNAAYTGKRFSTPEKKAFETECGYRLPPKIQLYEKMRIDFVFGFSTRAADVDGPVKLAQDVLQRKYGFNDNQVYELTARKEIVAKGNEYWSFKISEARV